MLKYYLSILSLVVMWELWGRYREYVCG